ncbi:MAG TPA: hypothetical protein VIO38_00740 [Rariglobus sp.]
MNQWNTTQEYAGAHASQVVAPGLPIRNAPRHVTGGAGSEFTIIAVRPFHKVNRSRAADADADGGDQAFHAQTQALQEIWLIVQQLSGVEQPPAGST